MAFFDDLGKKISQASQGAVAKGKELADIAKLNSQISDEEKRINNAYVEIGKKYVELHKNDAESDFADFISAIDEANKKIVDLRSQVADIKGVTKCPKCGAEVAKGVAFCASCGSPVPVASANAGASSQAAPSDTKRCGNCGAELSKDAGFCSECGAKVE